MLAGSGACSDERLMDWNPLECHVDFCCQWGGNSITFHKMAASEFFLQICPRMAAIVLSLIKRGVEISCDHIRRSK